MRLAPRSMSGQLLVVWVLAMLAAHVIAVLMLSWWRVDHSAIDPMSEWTIESHTAVAYRLVAFDGDRDSLLQKASLPDSVFRIGEKPANPAQMDDKESAIAQALRQLLGLPPERFVLVRLRQIEPDGHARDLRNWLEQTLSGKRALQLDVALELPDGQILLGRHQAEPAPAHWNEVLSFSLLVGMIPATLIAVFFGRRIIRPFKIMTKAVKRISRGEKVVLPPVKGPDSVREVTQAFNDMQDNLVRFVKGRTQMLAAIGHDLRTPLTSLRIRAELVEDEALREAMIRTLDDMGVMLEETLKFAEDDALQEPTQAVSLNRLVQEVVDEHRMQGREVHCESQLDDALAYRCRPVHLKRALNNLIDNAARYGAVSVRVRAEGSLLKIEVLDQGPGIDPGQLAQVFEPFVRLDSARSMATGGVGLGLTIAHSCARAHGGDIVLQNLGTGGLCAAIELPA